jgi:hypothetical protein
MWPRPRPETKKWHNALRSTAIRDLRAGSLWRLPRDVAAAVLVECLTFLVSKLLVAAQEPFAPEIQARVMAE